MYSTLTPSFKGNLLTHGHKILSRQTRVLGTAHSKDLMIIACVVLTQYRSVMDGQTDAQTMAKMREALHAVARKNSDTIIPYQSAKAKNKK